MTRRMGLLGGTFDPPHLGHVTVAREARHVLGLDQVVLIPAGSPPHKSVRALTPAALRLEMVEAAVEEAPGLAVSDMELRREGPSYTVDTLRQLRAERPGVELTLIIGADQLAELATWREPERIAELATLAVMNRGDVEPGAPASGPPIPWTPVAVTPMEVSSTDIRRRLAEGRPVEHLVPAPVLRIIEREKLYTNG